MVVFDEAQRAHDAATVARNHDRVRGFPAGLSEPELLLKFAERVSGWSVLVCLVGTGQEIHVGEEGGLRLWNKAIREACHAGWQVHGPAASNGVTADTSASFFAEPVLSLVSGVRFNLVTDVATFVERVLAAEPASAIRARADSLEGSGYHLRITRDLDHAKAYLRERYGTNLRARFGMIASSRDGTLSSFGVANDQDLVRRVKTGPWFVDDEAHFGGLSGRHLRSCMTEFQVQGLELDGALLAWGTDFVLDGGAWNSRGSRNYRRNSGVVDPHGLRVNSYRVLLTRAREVVVAFVPPVPALDETYRYLVEAGFLEVH